MVQKLYEIKEGALEVHIPIKNKGKFRWKKRDSLRQYGKVFATESIPYSDDAYIEWQVGYDIKKNEKKKETSLKELTFKGAKNEIKHPYELSEILFEMRKAGIVTEAEIQELKRQIKESPVSLEEQYAIDIVQPRQDSIGDIDVKKMQISLPAFVFEETADGPFVEISIQKQQYASGIGPMLYLSIPIKFLKNYGDLKGHTSTQLQKKGIDAIFVIDKGNKRYVLDTFRLFGICSKNHKQDVTSILECLESHLKELTEAKN